MVIRPELLDELLSEYKNPEDLISKNGLLEELARTLVERALEGEMTHHYLSYAKNASSQGSKNGNSRNGHSGKHLTTDQGPIDIQILVTARAILLPSW